MKPFTMNSKIKDIYRHPVGKDVISKILMQANQPTAVITNPLVSHLSLHSLNRLTRGKLGSDFFDTILRLLNAENGVVQNKRQPIQKAWWKEAVFYQIYPRSFNDGNGDGIGDIQGIIAKLDYLQKLGVDAIWLSPIYDSPNDDNGYDIRNYHEIMSDFGTMADFEKLSDAIHCKGMKLIMDLVVNHTSDEHPWFQSALKEPDSAYRDYYFMRESEPIPNNWTSFFGGSAWRYFEDEKLWSLHLFSSKQMDLNWDNHRVRQEVIDLVKWWLEKGVDGFRLDVINYISKAPGLPDGNRLIGELMEFAGVEHYFYGPRLHEFLHQLNREAFAPYQAFSVGETPGIGIETGKLLTGDYRQELDMIFNFDHLETPGHVRFDDYRYDLNYYKKYLIQYQSQYGSQYWMALFIENHDNPRMISKINPEPLYRDVIGKLLATIQLTLRGTPFIFQGQELGLVNATFPNINDFRDVESINKYHELKQNRPHKEALKSVVAGSRDHARVPMPWSKQKHAGFSDHTPWIKDHDDYLTTNVEGALGDSKSVLNYYRKLIRLRKSHETLIYGKVRFVKIHRKHYFAYYRSDASASFFIEMNLSDTPSKRQAAPKGYYPIATNYATHSRMMHPYETNIYQKK